MRFTWLTALLITLITSSEAYSTHSGPMRFSIFRPCSGSAPACAPRILAEGTIEADSAMKFTRFLAEKHIYPYGLPPKPTVCFDSNGGEILGAVNLGNKIREFGFDTCVEPNYRRFKPNTPLQREELAPKDAVCASACVFAMAGGVSREVRRGARVGVHQGANWKNGETTAQLSITALAGYLELMGVKSKLLDIASAYPPNQIYWLSDKEIRQLGLLNTQR
jgi:hypothetical protein